MSFVKSEADYTLLLNNDDESPRKIEQTSPSKKVLLKKQCPNGFNEYTVEINDTIERIALKWNTIPSELLRVNKLPNRMIFPGQILFVPDPNYIKPDVQIEKITETRRHSSIDETNFLKNQKIEINYENESSRSETRSFFSWRRNTSPKPGRIEKRHSIIGDSPRKQGKENIMSRHVLSEEDAKKLDEECMQRFLKLNSKLISYGKGIIDGVLLITPTALMFDPIRNHQHQNTSNEENTNELKSRNSSEDNADFDSIIIPIEIISNVILYENLALKDVHNYIEKSYDQINEDEEVEENKKELNNSNSLETSSVDNKTPPTNSINNHNTKEISQNNNEIEIELNKKEALRRHSISHILINTYDDTLLCYLCIKVNKHKEFITCPMDRRHKNRIQSEFWFQVPDNRTDSICAFFLSWKQDSTITQLNPNLKSGFQLVKDKKLVELTNQSSEHDIENIRHQVNEESDLFIKDWEIVNLKEFESKLKVELEELELMLPTLIGESKILKEDQIKLLNRNLISRAVSYNWMLTFSTENHGFSLSTIYRLMTDIDSPCLIVVKDTNNQIFGAMTSTNILQSDHFYGTGESFLFTFYPDFKIFKWTGENSFFIKGSMDSLGIGCGDGINGLWFDSDLYHGRSQKCKTYDNDILTLQEDFIIAAIEIWTFTD